MQPGTDNLRELEQSSNNSPDQRHVGAIQIELFKDYPAASSRAGLRASIPADTGTNAMCMPAQGGCPKPGAWVSGGIQVRQATGLSSHKSVDRFRNNHPAVHRPRGIRQVVDIWPPGSGPPTHRLMRTPSARHIETNQPYPQNQGASTTTTKEY